MKLADVGTGKIIRYDNRTFLVRSDGCDDVDVRWDSEGKWEVGIWYGQRIVLPPDTEVVLIEGGKDVS